MTEYNDVVENQKNIILAEKWAGEINYLLGQDGYIETAYNSGLVTRVYHRGPKEGTTEVIEPRMSRDQILGGFGAVEADMLRNNR